MKDATRRGMLSGGSLAMLAVAGAPDASVPDGIFDLSHFGVNAANRDNWAALQAAFDSAGAKNCPVFVLAPGNYRVSRPLRIQHPMTLLGAGAFDMNSAQSGSVIVGDEFPGPIFACEPSNTDRLRGFSISGILFHCRGHANGLSFRRCADFALARVGVRASAGFGIALRNSWDAVIVDAFVSACGTPDGRAGAIDILGEPFADNCNSLHFFGARIESSRGPGLVIHPAPLHAGPNNNIQFVASKFHHPAGDGSVAPTPNLVLGAAETISFHGSQIFDAGKDHPVIEFESEPSIDKGYSFFGCDIDVRAGAALLGGDLSVPQFFGCTLRADAAAGGNKPLQLARRGDTHHIGEFNRLYRVAL